MARYRIDRIPPEPFNDGKHVQRVEIECSTCHFPLQSDIDSGKELEADFNGFILVLKPGDKITMLD